MPESCDAVTDISAIIFDTAPVYGQGHAEGGSFGAGTDSDLFLIVS